MITRLLPQIWCESITTFSGVFANLFAVLEATIHDDIWLFLTATLIADINYLRAKTSLKLSRHLTN